jgi:predicted helicase
MTSGERDRRLNQLRAVSDGERAVLSNARCLAEGVDVPTLDGVAFIDPRRSQVDVVQAVGRAIRKAEDKTVGTVVIPVFVDEEGDAEQALEASEFDRVWQVVRALRDHDEVLAEELDEVRRELGRTGTLGQRPGKLVLDLPTTVGESFARAFDAKLTSSHPSRPYSFSVAVYVPSRNEITRYSHRCITEAYAHQTRRLAGLVPGRRRGSRPTHRQNASTLRTRRSD